MLFNMLEVASRHPWYKPGLGGLAAVTWSLLVSIRDLLGACAVLLAWSWAAPTAPAPLRSRAWVAPLLAAVWLLPSGALGANKLGGEPSSFHSVYYLIAGVAALVADRGRRGQALLDIPRLDEVGLELSVVSPHSREAVRL